MLAPSFTETVWARANEVYILEHVYYTHAKYKSKLHSVLQATVQLVFLLCIACKPLLIKENECRFFAIRECQNLCLQFSLASILFIFQVYPQGKTKNISCHMFPLVVYNMLASILHRIESLSFPHSMHTRGCSMVAASA